MEQPMPEDATPRDLQGDPRRHATWLESRRTWERDAFANLTAAFCAAAGALPRPAPGYRFHLAHLSDASIANRIREAKAAGALSHADLLPNAEQARTAGA